MRKRRSDSPWGKLTREQTRQMDIWRFEDNLSYAEIVKRALSDFGVTASEQTLTSYFKHRREELESPGDRPDIKFREQLALLDRPGMGKDLAELEARTLLFAGMSAYELSLADPEKMRVKEMRSLLKMLQDHRRYGEERKMKAKKLELQEMATMGKLIKDHQNHQTKAEFEEMMMDATDIMSRARQRWVQQTEALKAVKTKAGAGQGAEETTRAAGSNAESPIKDIIKDAEMPPQA